MNSHVLFYVLKIRCEAIIKNERGGKRLFRASRCNTMEHIRSTAVWRPGFASAGRAAVKNQIKVFFDYVPYKHNFQKRFCGAIKSFRKVIYMIFAEILPLGSFSQLLLAPSKVWHIQCSILESKRCKTLRRVHLSSFTFVVIGANWLPLIAFISFLIICFTMTFDIGARRKKYFVDSQHFTYPVTLKRQIKQRATSHEK